MSQNLLDGLAQKFGRDAYGSQTMYSNDAKVLTLHLLPGQTVICPTKTHEIPVSLSCALCLIYMLTCKGKMVNIIPAKHHYCY